MCVREEMVCDNTSSSQQIMEVDCLSVRGSNVTDRWTDLRKARCNILAAYAKRWPFVCPLLVLSLGDPAHNNLVYNMENAGNSCNVSTFYTEKTDAL